MRPPRLLFALAALAFLAWLACVGLFLELGTRDPYQWAFPGREDDLSRALYHGRKWLYVKAGVASFAAGVTFTLAGLLARRRRSRQRFP